MTHTSPFRRLRAALITGALLLACSGPAIAAEKGTPQVDLFSYAAGAQFVSVPADAVFSQMDSSPLNLIDGTPGTDWTGEAGGPPVFVLELAEETELSRIAFDTAGLNFDEKSPRAITVEVSTTSPRAGFTPVLSTNLRMKVNNQSFPFAPDKRPIAKWVRLTVHTNYGRDYSGFTGFRGYGRQLTQTAAMPDMTGRYDGASGIGEMSIVQQGNEITGCYAHQNGRFRGTVQGRRMLLDVVEDAADGQSVNRYRGVFGLSPNGREIVGLMRGTQDYERDTYALYYSATRVGKRPGPC